MSVEGNAQDILGKVDPDTLGIFWITDEKLANRPAPFYEFDYILDGLLTQYIRHNTKTDGTVVSEDKNLFVTKNFGEAFFVGHVEVGNTKVLNEVQQMMNILNNLNSTKKKILLLQTASTNHLKQLKSNFKNFEFEEFSY